MSAIPAPRATGNGYPTSDGKPMAETEVHRDLMFRLIQTLSRFFAGQHVCVSGNLFIFYEQGNRRRHISPDVFVARGVEERVRLNYLVWEEGKGPDLVIELTSSSTRHEDQTRKMVRYRDTLRVKEYFLFDPFGDYLDPRLQGFRLRGGTYVPVRPRGGRLPSQVIGLHLEQDGDDLRLWNPQTEAWVPTPGELLEQAQQQVQAIAAQLAAAQAQIAALQAGQANGHPNGGN